MAICLPPGAKILLVQIRGLKFLEADPHRGNTPSDWNITITALIIAIIIIIIMSAGCETETTRFFLLRWMLPFTSSDITHFLFLKKEKEKGKQIYSWVIKWDVIFMVFYFGSTNN